MMIFLPTSGGRGNASRPEKNQWAKKQPADRPAIIAAAAATAVEAGKNLLEPPFTPPQPLPVKGRNKPAGTVFSRNEALAILFVYW
jgi:hypothetical protein